MLFLNQKLSCILSREALVILRCNQLIRHPVKRLNFLLIQQRFGHLDRTLGLWHPEK